MSELRVLLADDHPLMRSGLRGLIDTQPNMIVVGEAADGESAARMALELRPDGRATALRNPFEITGYSNQQGKNERSISVTSSGITTS